MSSPESADRRVPSVLAIIETLAAMGFYTWLTATHGTVPLTVAGCVAPFLLLRTKESTDAAIRLAGTIDPLLVGAGCLVVPAAIFVLSLRSIGQQHWSLMWLYAVGACVVLFSGGFLVFRVSATAYCFLRAPINAIRSIPFNWARICGCVDLAHPPEMLAGLALSVKTNDGSAEIVSPGGKLSGVRLAIALPLRLAVMVRPSMEADGTYRLPRRLQWLRAPMELFFLPYSIAIVGGTIAVALWYRLSVKGTALIWLPLLWFASDAPKSTPKDVVESWFWKGLLAGSLSILTFAAALALRRTIGVDLSILGPYDQLIARLPPGSWAWEVLAIAGAADVFAICMYAQRLNRRAPSDGQKPLLELLVSAFGLIVVLFLLSVLFLFIRASWPSRA